MIILKFFFFADFIADFNSLTCILNKILAPVSAFKSPAKLIYCIVFEATSRTYEILL